MLYSLYFTPWLQPGEQRYKNNRALAIKRILNAKAEKDFEKV